MHKIKKALTNFYTCGVSLRNKAATNSGGNEPPCFALIYYFFILQTK